MDILRNWTKDVVGKYAGPPDSMRNIDTILLVLSAVRLYAPDIPSNTNATDPTYNCIFELAATLADIFDTDVEEPVDNFPGVPRARLSEFIQTCVNLHDILAT